MINHFLLHPTMADADLHSGCEFSSQVRLCHRMHQTLYGAPKSCWLKPTATYAPLPASPTATATVEILEEAKARFGSEY